VNILHTQGHVFIPLISTYVWTLLSLCLTDEPSEALKHELASWKLHKVVKEPKF